MVRRATRRSVVLAVLVGAVGGMAIACTPAGAIQTVEYRAGITQGLAGGLAGIAAGSDGNLWFTEQRGRIGRISPAGPASELTGFPSGLLTIAAGPDGAIWFTTSDDIGRVTVDGLTRSSFPIGPAPTGIPTSLVAGPDRAVWFTTIDGPPAVGRLAIDGSLTSFTPSYQPPSLPAQIAVGPDGALWYAESGEGFGDEHGSQPSFRGIVRITTAGAITPFPLRSRVAHPLDIVAGPDGALWFTSNGTLPMIGRLTTGGRYTLYHARAPRGLFVGSIAAGADGNLWYTTGRGRIGRITPRGLVTVFRTPSRAPAPGDLAAGPDGNLWMTDASGGVVKVTPPRGRCVVPRVVGLHFASAVRRLHRVQCTVGRVAASRRSHRGRLFVQHQFPHRGTRLPAESAVDLMLRR
jgi:virginiamycin B lyase